MQDLMHEIQTMTSQLTASVKLLRKTGSDYAEAERNYKIKVHEKVLELKSDGMPATLINQLIYGVKEVADLRVKRDIAKVVYDANQESINSLKLQIRLLESQISREWNNG